MRKILSVFIFAAVSVSCATVFNKSSYPISFSSSLPNSKIKINDSSYQLPAEVMVRRQKKDLLVTFSTDSLSKEFTFYPVNDPKIWINFSFMQLAPAAFLADFLSPQHYTYGKKINFELGDSLYATNSTPRSLNGRASAKWKRYFSEEYPESKGQVNFVAGITLVNALLIDNAYARRENWAFGGLKLGLEYFFANQHYLSFSGTYILPQNDLFFGEYYGPNDYTQANAFYLNLNSNYACQRISIGYGISYTQSSLHVVKEIATQFDERFFNNGFGANINFQIRFIENFHASLVYNPTFYEIKPDAGWNYEHLFSLEFIYKLRLRKPR